MKSESLAPFKRYVWSGTQWLYLALVIDLYARRIIGWACSDSLDSVLTG